MFETESVNSAVETAAAPVKQQGPWGINAFKPIEQKNWENAVRQEVDKMIQEKIQCWNSSGIWPLYSTQLVSTQGKKS